MTALVIAVVGAGGVYLLYSSLAFGQRSLVSQSPKKRNSVSRQLDDWMVQAGLSDVTKRQLAIFIVAMFIGGVVLGWMLFGGALAPVLIGLFSATFPVATYKTRRQRRRAEAAEAWPRMIEEIRLLTGSLGRPIPQALIAVGKQGPAEFRSAFDKAEREWLLSTDFEKTVVVLKQEIAEPTADATCETLLVAHEIGGSDINSRLAALATDRQLDTQGRKDAKAQQAGVRFARRFVLLVPIGMALAGLSIGDGRSAYETTEGQLGVVAGLFTLAACWRWAGRLIRLPEEQRVFRA